MFPGPGTALAVVTHSSSNAGTYADKPTDSKANPTKEGTTKEATPQATTADASHTEIDSANPDTKAISATTKDDPPEEKTLDDSHTIESVPSAGSAAIKGRTSKNSTPVVSTFSEAHQPRSRHARNNTDSVPARRSHKKNGSLSVAQAAAAEATEDEESSREGDDEDEEGEPRYCYCNEISFGEMVACDNDACPREWFHLSCVGLTKPPGKNGKCILVSRQETRLILDFSEMVLQRMQREHETRPNQRWEITLEIECRSYDHHPARENYGGVSFSYA